MSENETLLKELIEDELDLEAIFLPEDDSDDEESFKINNFQNQAIELFSIRDHIIKKIAGDIATIYATDTGEIRLILDDIEAFIGEILGGLIGGSTKCTRRRVKDLARSWRNLIEASRKTNIDVNEVYRAAAKLRHNAKGRSRMFNRCFKHMKSRNAALADIFELGIKVITAYAAA